MRLDAALPPTHLGSVAEIARAAEATGFAALWTTETQHDPFLPHALIAEHTTRLQSGTAVAIGFARSPATLAYTAWDLAQASSGPFPARGWATRMPQTFLGMPHGHSRRILRDPPTKSRRGANDGSYGE